MKTDPEFQHVRDFSSGSPHAGLRSFADHAQFVVRQHGEEAGKHSTGRG